MQKFILILLLCSQYAIANNINISNISIAANASHTGKMVEFDLSWENSWRTGTTATDNFDGAWIFFKFKNGDGSYQPISLSNADILLPTGYAIELAHIGNLTANPSFGGFIYRTAAGQGTVNLLNVQLGIVPVPGVADVMGFALEMVYIPDGAFDVGDGIIYDAGNVLLPNYKAGGSSVSNNPAPNFTITSTSTPMGSTTGTLNDIMLLPVFTGTLTSVFPNGFSSFWVMKYQLSRAAVRDFLNSLTFNQQTGFFSNVGVQNDLIPEVLGIEIKTIGNAVTNTPNVYGCDDNGNNIFDEPNDGQWKFATGFCWRGVASFLDWAGLRPLTELEYEKICRGTNNAVQYEYAWGTVEKSTTNYTLLNNGTVTESVANPDLVKGNVANIPMRSGIFATSTSNRITSGAGFYGVFELSDDYPEACVTTGCAAGRSFRNIDGDGILHSNSWANTAYWPGNGGDQAQFASLPDGNVTVDSGIILRHSRVSQRPYLTYSNSSVPKTVYNPKLSIRGAHRSNL